MSHLTHILFAALPLLLMAAVLLDGAEAALLEIRGYKGL